MAILLQDPGKQLQAVLHKLKYQQSEFLVAGTGMLAKPPSPINEVNTKRLGINLIVRGNFRNLFLLPWLLGICLTLYWNVTGFYEGWKLTEQSQLRFIKIRKEKYGEDYFDRLRVYVEKEEPNHIGEEYSRFAIQKSGLTRYDRIVNGKMSFKNYLDYRYHGAAYPKRILRGDIGLLIFYLISVPTLFISYLSFRRRAPLYFDRGRNLVYTWLKGQVWAQNYDDLLYYHNKHGMGMILYGFDPVEEFVFKSFVISPSGNPYFNSEFSYWTLLTYTTKYMVNGRDAVIKKDWKGRQGFYLFKDKKPDDFDEQLESVLKYIKDNKVNEQAETLAKEWGYLQTDEAPAS